MARAREAALSRQLAAIETEVAPASATSLQRRLESLASAARMRVGAGGAGAMAGTRLDERSSAQLLGVLKDHAAGLAKLQVGYEAGGWNASSFVSSYCMSSCVLWFAQNIALCGAVNCAC